MRLTRQRRLLYLLPANSLLIVSLAPGEGDTPGADSVYQRCRGARMPCERVAVRTVPGWENVVLPCEIPRRETGSKRRRRGEFRVGLRRCGDQVAVVCRPFEIP